MKKLFCYFILLFVLNVSAEDKVIDQVACQQENLTNNVSLHLQNLNKSIEGIAGASVSNSEQKKKAGISLENGCVSMSFDDGYQAVFNHALPLFKKYGMVGTAYITTGVTSKEGYMSWDQLHDLEQQGWEIGAHSDTHPEFEKMPLKDVKKEAFTSQDKLKKHGLNATGFAFPYGSYNQAEIALLSTKFAELRGFWDRDELNNPTSMNASLVQVKGIVKETTPAEIKAWLEQAKKEKSCLALVFHDLSAKEAYTGSLHHIRDDKTDVPANYDFTYNLDTLNVALEAVRDSGLPVVTESQMVKIPGVPVLTGTFGGKDGEWSLKSGAVIDHNMHGSFPNGRDSVKLDEVQQNADGEMLISKTIDLQKLPKVRAEGRKMVFEAYFNALEMKGGSIKIKVQELGSDGSIIRTVDLTELGSPGARRIRQFYSPTDTNVAQIRLVINPQDLKGKVFVSNPILNEY